MTWHDRVAEKMAARRVAREMDSQAFEKLCGYLDNGPRQYGEELVLSATYGQLHYMGKPVLTFSVENGQIVVGNGLKLKQFADRELALDYMATLMAVALESNTPTATAA